jgi:serine O-acetyltransferase
MSTSQAGDELSFSKLVFSDLARFRGGATGWVRVLLSCLTTPGMIASIVVRAQQCLHRAGHAAPAKVLRTVGNVLLGADFGPGMRIGPGLMMPHPNGVTIGFGLVIGTNVTLAGGATAAARYYDLTDATQEFATICDGAVIGAHAVLVGGVRIGEDAMVGANSVVLSDVPDHTVVLGNPARRVGTRDSAA